MSGTSLDGVDVALVKTDGETIEQFGNSHFRAYSGVEADVLRAELGAWEASRALTELLTRAHSEALRKLSGYEVVGFHGQTLAHDPANGRTHQAGDGKALADALGVPVVWDFRSSDVEMGGEGAPLAPFFHHACARLVGAREPVAFLNLGGVGNISWVDPRISRPELEGALLAFDTGPANAPLNDLVKTRLGLTHDVGGLLARRGRVDVSVVEAFFEHPYFRRPAPKSLDRDEFGSLVSSVAHLSDADAAATLAAISAAAVVEGMRLCPSEPKAVYVCGGGRHNETLMSMLRAGLDCDVAAVEDIGLDGDMLEAQAFAYLAVRVLRGLPTSGPSTTGVRMPIGGGRVSRP